MAPAQSKSERATSFLPRAQVADTGEYTNPLSHYVTPNYVAEAYAFFRKLLDGPRIVEIG